MNHFNGRASTSSHEDADRNRSFPYYQPHVDQKLKTSLKSHSKPMRGPRVEPYSRQVASTSASTPPPSTSTESLPIPQIQMPFSNNFDDASSLLKDSAMNGNSLFLAQAIYHHFDQEESVTADSIKTLLNLIKMLSEKIINHIDASQAFANPMNVQDEESEETNLEDNDDQQKIALERIKYIFPIKTEAQLRIFDDSLRDREIRKAVKKYLMQFKDLHELSKSVYNILNKAIDRKLAGKFSFTGINTSKKRFADFHFVKIIEDLFKTKTITVKDVHKVITNWFNITHNKLKRLNKPLETDSTQGAIEKLLHDMENN